MKLKAFFIAAATAISMVGSAATAATVVAPTVVVNGGITEYSFGDLTGDNESSIALDLATNSFFAIDFFGTAPSGTLDLDVTNSGVGSDNMVTANLLVGQIGGGSYDLLLDGGLLAAVPANSAASKASFTVLGGETRVLTWSWSNITTDEVAQVSTNIVPNPIPLPAAAWMLLAGLAGMVALRRRQTA